MAQPTLSERLAAEIRAELARQRLTTKHLIDTVYGVSPATLRRKVSGQYPLSVDELERIATALDLTAAELVERAADAESVVA